jgi:hypothetical protein
MGSSCRTEETHRRKRTVPLGRSGVPDKSPGGRRDQAGRSAVGTGDNNHGTRGCPGGRQGAVAQLEFQGRTVLVFSKLGTNCGQVAIRIDEAPAETVDTCSADDIWGVCIWRKPLATAGPHRLRIEVLDQHGPRANGDLVRLDGVRIEAK